MGLLNRLFGKSESRATPANHEFVHLAAGRGFTFNIVGESQFQKGLSKICGGKTTVGHKLEATAHLTFAENAHDATAIAVQISGEQVGWMPSELSSEMRREITALSPNGSVTCRAKIVGGWRSDGDEGSFGVKLCLSVPLKKSKPRY
jgi:hypothetical protein